MPATESPATAGIRRSAKPLAGSFAHVGAVGPIRAARFVERVACRMRLRGLLVLLVVYVPFYAVYFGSAAAFSIAHAQAACGGRPILDARWSYTAAVSHDYLTACGPDGRTAIAHQQIADLIYPALYAAVLTVAFALLLRFIAPTHATWHLLVLLPLITAGLDYVENIGVSNQLGVYPGPAALVPLFSTITGVKQGLGYACLAVLAMLLIAAGITAWRRRHSQPQPVG
jgi:hypothetical protein